MLQKAVIRNGTGEEIDGFTFGGKYENRRICSLGPAASWTRVGDAVVVLPPPTWLLTKGSPDFISCEGHPHPQLRTNHTICLYAGSSCSCGF